MDIKLIINIFKIKQTKEKSKNLTNEEIIHNLVKSQARKKLIEKRERQELLFPRGRDFLHRSYMEDMENAYDEALIEILSEHHRF